MGNRKQMNESWLNIQWFKRKTLHEYQSGGEESALEYIDHISDLLSDSDYDTLLEKLPDCSIFLKFSLFIFNFPDFKL